MPFEIWAVDRTWKVFVPLYHLSQHIQPFALRDWATNPPIPGAKGKGFSSTVLARRVISGLVLCNAVMKDLRADSRKAHAAVKGWLDTRRVAKGQERALAKGKRFIFDWLVRAAELDARIDL